MPWWSWVLIGALVWVTAVVVAFRVWATWQFLQIQRHAVEKFERDFPAPGRSAYGLNLGPRRGQRDPFDRP